MTDDQIEREEACNAKFAKLLGQLPGLNGEVLELARNMFWLGWEEGANWMSAKALETLKEIQDE